MFFGRSRHTVAVEMRAALDGCDRALDATARTSLCATLLAGVIAIAAAAAFSIPAPRTSKPVASVNSSVPLAARLAVSRALGRSETQFAVERAGQEYRARAGGGVAATFTARGASIGKLLTLGLTAIDRAGRTTDVGRANPVAAATNQIDYRRSGALEWYSSGPLGLEQGFTLTRRPAGDGGLTLTVGRIAPHASAKPLPGRNGITVADSAGRITYGRLTVTDARGTTLPASIGVDGRRIVLLIDDAGARYPLRVDPLVQSQLTAGNVTLGVSVAMSGRTIVATGAGNTAYVFTEPSSGWGDATSPNATLTGGDSGQYGSGVAISGDTIVVGASRQTVDGHTLQGAALVFQEPSGGWTGTLTPSATLIAGDGAAGDALGDAVAISGNTVVAAAPDRKVGTDNVQGALYVYVKPAGGWAGTLDQSAELSVTGQTNAGVLGAAGDGQPIVSISADTIVAGECAGGAFVFTRPTGGWAGALTQAASLSTTATGNVQEYIGCEVAISGGTILAGDPSEGSGPDNPGTVWLYTEPPGGWSGTVSETGQLTAPGLGDGSGFGFSLAISGQTAAVGAWYGGDNNQGTAYLYTMPMAGWSGTIDPSSSFTDPSGDIGDQFGNAVAVDGDALAVAAEDENDPEGAVYVYAPSGATDATSTTVECVPGSLATGVASTCTAAVSDTAGSGQTSPGGTVTFSASPGSGLFGSSAACTLEKSTSSSSTCSVAFTPSAGGSYTITGTYEGESNHLGSSGAGSISATATQKPPPPTPVRPVNTARPSISGSGKAGGVLTCAHGTWTGAPISYVYGWAIDGTPIVGATTSSYEVQNGDEQLTITCTVTASNSAGAGTPATSNGIFIPVPKVKGCPAASGRLSGTTLGLVHLGMTSAQARHGYTHSSTRGFKYKDFFCLTPNGVRVGLGSPSLLKTVPKAERKRYANKVVWISTSSAYFAVKGIRAGATVAAASRALHTGTPFHIGANYWYLAANGSSTAVLKVRGGIVEEIGIGVKQLTTGRKAQRAFLTSFD
jgi:FG-GAP repeat